MIPDKDFILYFGASEGQFGASLVTSKQKTQDGFFALFLAPKHEISEEEVIPKDLVFVVDTSGSMKEPAAKPWKIDQAKGALRFCINSLGPKDRFNIISFSTGTRTFRNALQPVNNDTRTEAAGFIDSLEARGGTNIHEALEVMLALQNADATRPFIVVFLTDGQPTVGELQSAEELVALVGKKAGPNTRFFSFGVGYDVNTHLLDKLAITNRGDRVYVSPEENIELKVSGFYDKIASPVLSDLSVQIDSIETYDLVPVQVPDLFRGSQLVLYGRYKGEGHSAIRVKGTIQGKPAEFVYESAFPAISIGHAHIPRLWALTKIGYLLDQLRLKGFDVSSGYKPSGPERELVDEIVALATEYGVVTPYTAMLVLEDTKYHGPGALSPAGLRMVDAKKSSDFSHGVNEAMEALGGTSGKGAFDASRAARQLQAGVPMAGDKEEDAVSKALNTAKTFKQVEDKTFILVDGTWYDSTYKQERKMTEIVFLSDAYFTLIEEKPELARYLSAGARVVVCLENTVYAIIQG
ncbi:MAG: VWA domain-containing protein [Planctomycetota bacterium]